MADKLDPERRELLAGIDGRAADADVADMDLDVGRPARRRRAGEDNVRAARLSQRRGRRDEALGHSPGRVTSSENLRRGRNRQQHRRKPRNQYRAGAHNRPSQPPSIPGFNRQVPQKSTRFNR